MSKTLKHSQKDYNKKKREKPNKSSPALPILEIALRWYARHIQVSFTSEFVADPPLLVPSWQGNGCDDCTEFSSGFPRGGGAYVNVSSEASIGEWEEQSVLQASDRRSGDRFGSTLALDQVKQNKRIPSWTAKKWIPSFVQVRHYPNPLRTEKERTNTKSVVSKNMGGVLKGGYTRVKRVSLARRMYPSSDTPAPGSRSANPCGTSRTFLGGKYLELVWDNYCRREKGKPRRGAKLKTLGVRSDHVTYGAV